MNKSDSIKELATALAKAQGTIKGALKDSSNPFFKTKYADLASVVEAIRQPLADGGLSYVQISHESKDAACIETVILHSSGEWLSCGPVSVPVTKADAQGFGSAMTYSRRYSLSAAFGVAPEDDDGNAAAAAKPTAGEGGVPAKAKTFSVPHKPTDGALESLTPDERTWIHDISNEVRSLAVKGDIKGACDQIDSYDLNSDQKTALWAKLADVSTVRSAMKKEWESRKDAK